jgi:2-phosphosulfolactate phosphatase
VQVSILRPSAASALPRDTDVCVVIDVLRATTTASVLCDRLAKICLLRAPADLEHLPVDAVGYALFSELRGVEVDIPRFDNSPVQAKSADLAGRTPVLVTTNGTLAVGYAVRIAHEVVLGSFVNLTAIADYLRAKQPAKVVLMPAGNINKDQLCLEDDKCADAIAAQLAGQSFDLPVAITACRDEPRIMRRIAAEPGLDRDLDLCFTVDAVPVVPRVTGTSADRYFSVARARST